MTATTRPSSGLRPMPGATSLHAPGTTTGTLYARFLRERPAGDLADMTPMNAVARFQAAYASEMSWRQQQSISAKELLHQIGRMPFRIHFSWKNSDPDSPRQTSQRG